MTKKTVTKSTTSAHSHRAQRAEARKHKHRQRAVATGLGGVLVLLLAIGAILSVSSDDTDAPGVANADSAPAAQFTATPYAGGPRLAIDQRTVDHGDVAYGQEVQAVYRLMNTGDQPLKIEQPEVRTLDGCWPPQPVVGQTTLQPGDVTTLSVAFAMHEGMGGRHTFEIVIPTNDTVEPETSVTVAATYPLP